MPQMENPSEVSLDNILWVQAIGLTPLDLKACLPYSIVRFFDLLGNYLAIIIVTIWASLGRYWNQLLSLTIFL